MSSISLPDWTPPFIKKTVSYFEQVVSDFQQNLPQNGETEDYVLFIKSYSPSGGLLYNVLSATCCILLAFLIYIYYTTTEMTDLIINQPEFSELASTVSTFSTIILACTGLYLLLFLYMLRSNSTNLNPEGIQYALNVLLFLTIAVSTFNSKITSNISTINFNSLLNPTLLPTVISVRTTQESVTGLFVLFSVLIWFFAAAIPDFCDISLWALSFQSKGGGGGGGGKK